VKTQRAREGSAARPSPHKPWTGLRSFGDVTRAAFSRTHGPMVPLFMLTLADEDAISGAHACRMYRHLGATFGANPFARRFEVDVHC
jgi:hypothetical protein